MTDATFKSRRTAPSADVQVAAKSLDEKAMLADLTIKGWSGRATDKAAAEFTAQQHQANVSWVRFTKRLVNADALKAIKKVEAAAREVHKKYTLPWSEKGQRILPAAAFTDYQREIGDLSDAHANAVDAFVAEYASLIEEARRELGGLFDEADYPDQHEVFAKFCFETELNTLDVRGDFRVQMSDGEMKRLQQQIESRTEARLNSAMSDAYHRLHEVVAHMAERLRAYKPAKEEGEKIQNPFRDKTIENVRDLVDLLPKLNVTNDPALTALTDKVRSQLLDADAATLRSDDERRAQVAQAADDIVDAMAGMM